LYKPNFTLGEAFWQGIRYGKGSVENKLGWVILLNSLIAATEYFGGVISGSLALISDAGHNFTDVLALILSYFGEKISRRKPSLKNSFGLKRFEIFTAMVNALALWGIGLLIVIEACKRAVSAAAISPLLMLVIAIVGLLGNLFSLLVLHKEWNYNLNLKAVFLHMFYDLLSSCIVVFSAVAIAVTGRVLPDIVASAFIAVMIFWSGFGIIAKAAHIFMQGVPEGIDASGVRASILGIEGVGDVHDLHIWSINSREVFLSCHVCARHDGAFENNDGLIKK